MSMQINSSTSAIGTVARQPSDAAVRIASRREAYKEMGSAMQSGDLSSARSAYATMVRNAPPGATLQAGSPMAQLGKALVTGDMSAAQSTWSEMVAKHQGSDGVAPQAPVDTLPNTPSASSTGGVAGAMLDVTA
jgi:outer membrane protein assembly factor BamD (BamD/ComL family)